MSGDNSDTASEDNNKEFLESFDFSHSDKDTKKLIQKEIARQHKNKV